MGRSSDTDIRRVDLGISCADLDQSLAFYQSLGFPLEAAVEIPRELAVSSGLAAAGYRQVRLRAGPSLLKFSALVGDSPGPAGPAVPGVRWMTFVVGDLRRVLRRLERTGVGASPPLAGVTGTLVTAQGPDGLLLEFLQPY